MTPLLATFTESARSFKVTPSRHPTFLHPSSFPHPHSLAWSEDRWEWLGLWWQRWQELSDRFYGSGGHEGNEPWPRGWDLPPPPPAARWPESRTPAVAATRGFRRLTAQDVSSLGPYLVKVFRDSVIRLQGGGGPGSVPGERAAAPAFLKSASRPPTPGSPLREGPQGWLAESGVCSSLIPSRSAGKQNPGLRCGRLEAQGAAKIMSLFPSTRC